MGHVDCAKSSNCRLLSWLLYWCIDANEYIERRGILGWLVTERGAAGGGDPASCIVKPLFCCHSTLGAEHDASGCKRRGVLGWLVNERGVALEEVTMRHIVPSHHRQVTNRCAAESLLREPLGEQPRRCSLQSSALLS